MEEKKEKTVSQNSEKLTYEQLESACHQLSEQYRALYQKLQEVNMANAFKRLDYLFKVIECNRSFPVSFVESCTKEVVDIMTVPEETPEDSKE